MPDWRAKILNEITSSIGQITLISDPDNLLGDQKIQAKLRENGYSTYKYTDHILFRYTFETKYRTQLQTQNTKLIIITDTPRTSIEQKIPYDIFKKSHKVYISLSQLFQKLDYITLKDVSTNEIDRLYAAYQNYRGEKIGQRETKEFLLKTLYGIDPQSIITQTDYISSLINSNIPDNLLAYLNNYLQQNQNAPEKLYENEQQLITHLQNEWNDYVKNKSNQTTSLINDPKIRTQIIQCLLNAQISPVPVASIQQYPQWMRLGLIDNSREAAIQTINANIEKISLILQSSQQLNHRDWLTVTSIWSQIVVLKNELDEKTSETWQNILDLEHTLDSLFIPWIIENHQSLYYMREKKPITLSHISDYIYKNRSKPKTALLIIDGMSLDQWIKIKQSLEAKTPDTYLFDEMPVFASIPTITSVSRQTIITGTEPTIFENESQAFNKEESLWSSNWQRRDIVQGYIKGLKLMDKKDIIEISELLDRQVLLLITDHLDNKVHEAINGKHEVYREIDYWINTGLLNELLEILFSDNYEVYVTSDHGNVESIGVGELRQGVLSQKESSRVRLYDEYVFAQQATQLYHDSILMPDREDASHFFVYAPDRKSFRRLNERQVSHGGLTIEEVIVPLVRIERIR